MLEGRGLGGGNGDIGEEGNFFFGKLKGFIEGGDVEWYVVCGKFVSEFNLV